MESGGFLHVFWRDEAGVTALEYALIGSLVAVAVAISVDVVGVNLSELYNMVAGRVKGAISG